MSDSKIDCKQLEQLRDSLEAMAMIFLKLHQERLLQDFLQK